MNEPPIGADGGFEFDVSPAQDGLAVNQISDCLDHQQDEGPSGGGQYTLQQHTQPKGFDQAHHGESDRQPVRKGLGFNIRPYQSPRGPGKNGPKQGRQSQSENMQDHDHNGRAAKLHHGIAPGNTPTTVAAPPAQQQKRQHGNKI
jgi:hypothetical protein